MPPPPRYRELAARGLRRDGSTTIIIIPGDLIPVLRVAFLTRMRTLECGPVAFPPVAGRIPAGLARTVGGGVCPRPSPRPPGRCGPGQARRPGWRVHPPHQVRLGLPVRPGVGQRRHHHNHHPQAGSIGILLGQRPAPVASIPPRARHPPDRQDHHPAPDGTPRTPPPYGHKTARRPSRRRYPVIAVDVRPADH